MDSKKVGLIFLIEILITIGASIGVSIGSSFFRLSLVWSLILSELILLVPVLLFALIFERNFWRDDSMGYEDGLIAVGCSRKYVLLLVPVFTLFCMPLISLCNAISLVFVKNEMASMTGNLLDMPLWMSLALLAVFGPLCEEIVFRGILYGGLRRSGNVVGAILLQALFFGLAHLNLNQFCYTFTAGIIMALLVEATGSIEASYYMHMCINGFSTVMSYVIMDGESTEAATAVEGAYDGSMFLAMIPILVCVAAVSTAIAFSILMLIARLSGREADFLSIILFEKRESESKKNTRLLNLPMILGVLLALVVIIAEAILEHVVL